MKKCLTCGATYPTSTSHCSACGAEPDKQEGFAVYAPALVQGGGGFKAAYFADIARLEAGHFWFRVRNRLIIWALDKYCNKFQSFLEIGCGTGYVLSGITNAFPEAQIHGSEIFTAGLAFAAAKQPTIDFMQMDARHIPFVDEFDAIGAFDVLEHIKEDESVLIQIHEALKLHGVMLLTVPQHKWLWSSVDEYSCHNRRYTAHELHNKVARAGFTIVRSTSFVTSLLPSMLISRLFQRGKSESFVPQAESRIHPILNRIFEWFLCLELWLIQIGVSFPVGGSRLVVAAKKDGFKILKG